MDFQHFDKKLTFKPLSHVSFLMSRTEIYVHKGSYHVTNIANRFKVVVGQSVISRSVNLSKVSTALSPSNYTLLHRKSP